MSYTFAQLFQSKVTSEAYVEATIGDLLTASANASTAQYPINEKKGEALVKSVVKTGSLLIAPLMVLTTLSAVVTGLGLLTVSAPCTESMQKARSFSRLTLLPSKLSNPLC